MTNRRFIILEQHDGRYLVVCPPFATSMGWDSKAEVLVDWAQDVRSLNKCYAEVAEYMIDSGCYLEGPAQIEFVRYPA